MRVLIVTKIFPNQVEPLSSPFNRKQFAALGRLCEVEVLASIPWFPGVSAFRRLSGGRGLSAVPDFEVIDGLNVRHPRFVFLPRIGHAVSGPLYAASLAKTALQYRGRIDIVLGSWAYPDGFAAVVLAEILSVPVVIKLHGSDINVVARMPGPRRRLEWALPRADRVVAVSRPLAEAALGLGVAKDRIDLVPNGIDRDAFQPRDRDAARRELGLPNDKRIVLYVGNVLETKGALDLVRAFGEAGTRLAHARLVMLGGGKDFEACAQLVKSLGVDAQLLGPKPHSDVPKYLAAADVLALPSWNEGMPNVVLEALASGRRVVATNVGGIPDIVTSETLGILVPPKNPGELAGALERVLSSAGDPELISRSLPNGDWEQSACALYQSLLSALEARARDAA
jgi:teichuronic acid biosynthesis glycosyltransferase TuaC